MERGWLFPSEDTTSVHPDDARHWAMTYAELIRTLPPVLYASELPAMLAERLEWWEARLRILLHETPHLASRYNRRRRTSVRTVARASTPLLRS